MNEEKNVSLLRAKSAHWIFKIAVILMGVCGVAICTLWYPFGTVLGVLGNPADEIYLAEMIFYYATALPCFTMLVFFWKVSDLIQVGRLFSYEAAKCFTINAIILFIDLIVFLIGNIVFYILNANVWLIVYVFFVLCGCVVDLLLFVMAKYLKEAAILQEESDGTV